VIPPGSDEPGSGVTRELPTGDPYKPYRFGDTKILRHPFPHYVDVRLRGSSTTAIEREVVANAEGLGFVVVRKDPAGRPGFFPKPSDPIRGLVIAERDLRWDKTRTLRSKREGWVFIGVAVGWGALVPLMFAGEYYNALRFSGATALLLFATGPIIGLAAAEATQLSWNSYYWSSILPVSYKEASNESSPGERGPTGAGPSYEVSISCGLAFILNQKSVYFRERRILQVFDQDGSAETVARIRTALEGLGAAP
jgi:hypothetical protein